MSPVLSRSSSYRSPASTHTELSPSTLACIIHRSRPTQLHHLPTFPPSIAPDVSGSGTSCRSTSGIVSLSGSASAQAGIGGSSFMAIFGGLIVTLTIRCRAPCPTPSLRSRITDCLGSSSLLQFTTLARYSTLLVSASMSRQAFSPNRTMANKTDAGNGSKAICRVSNVLRSPSPDPRRSPNPKRPSP